MPLSLILLFLQLWGDVRMSLSQNVTCPELPNVAHAFVSEGTKQAEYLEGHVIHFTCETGYISGPTIRYECSSNGWLPIHEGTCYLKPCELPDETPNGYYEIIEGEDFVFGTVIKYFCNEGYYMVSKEDTRTCKLDKWTHHVPICDPMSCDLPPPDEQVTVGGLTGNENHILPDRFLTFRCDDPGKELNGSSVLVCGKDGQWDHPFPTCEDITCKIDKKHPHLSVRGVSPANDRVKIGLKLRFQCNNEYALEGSVEIECLSSGMWNAPLPTCVETCKVINVPASVRIIHGITSRVVKKGQKLTFACSEHGHILRGNEVVVCSAHQQWSDPFPTCGAPLGCGRPPPLANGDLKESVRFKHSHNEKVEYVCQDYYTMEGNPFRTCRDNVWIGQMKCLNPCTVDEEVMGNHNIAFKFGHKPKLYSPHNDEIEFRCVGQRTPVGGMSMRRACIDGVMHLPTCH